MKRLFAVISIIFILGGQHALADAELGDTTDSTITTNPANQFLPDAPTSIDFSNGASFTDPAANSFNSEANQKNLLFEGPTAVYNLILGLFTLISVIVSIAAGLKIVYAAGDAKKFQEGLMMLVYTVLGYLIIAGSWFIIRFVLNFGF